MGCPPCTPFPPPIGWEPMEMFFVPVGGQYLCFMKGGGSVQLAKEESFQATEHICVFIGWTWDCLPTLPDLIWLFPPIRWHQWDCSCFHQKLKSGLQFISVLKYLVTDPSSVNKFSCICLFFKHSTLSCKIQRLLTREPDWGIVLHRQYFRISCGTSFFHWLHFNRVPMVGKNNCQHNVLLGQRPHDVYVT